MRRYFSTLVAIILAILSIGGTASASEASYENQSGFVLWPCDNAVVDGKNTVKVQISASKGSLSPTDETVTLSSNSGDIIAYAVAPGIFDTGVIAQELPVAFSGIKATSGAVLTAEIVEGATCPKPDPVYNPYVHFGELVCEDGAPSAPVTLDNTESSDVVGFDVSTSSGYFKLYSVKAGSTKDVFVPLEQGTKSTVSVSAFDVELASEVFDARKCVEPSSSATPSPSNTETSSPSPVVSVTITDHDMTSEPEPSSSLIPPTSTTKPADKSSSAAAAPAELPKTGGGMTKPLAIGALMVVLVGATLIAAAGRYGYQRKH